MNGRPLNGPPPKFISPKKDTVPILLSPGTWATYAPYLDRINEVEPVQDCTCDAIDLIKGPCGCGWLATKKAGK